MNEERIKRRWLNQSSMTLLLFAVGLLLLCGRVIVRASGYDIGYGNVAMAIVGVALMIFAPRLARYATA